MKKKLTKEELFDYILECDGDVDIYQVEALFDDLGNFEAELVTIPIDSLILGPEDNHLTNESKQDRYNNLKSEPPPIIVNFNNEVLDGHHRIRSQIYKKQSDITAYRLVFLKLNT